MTVFVLIDSRLEPQKIDLAFLTWLGTKEIPIAIVFTKADKLSKQQALKQTEIFKKKMLETWAALPPLFISSSEKKTGREEMLGFIDDVNKSWNNPDNQ